MASNEAVVTMSIRDLDEVKAEIEGLRARVAIARQAFNVVYNCKGAPEQWERGKRILAELQEQYDGIAPLTAVDGYSSTHKSVELVIESARSVAAAEDYVEGSYGSPTGHDEDAMDRLRSALRALDAAREGK